MRPNAWKALSITFLPACWATHRIRVPAPSVKDRTAARAALDLALPFFGLIGLGFVAGRHPFP
jgi:hypothetical protein